MEVQFQLERDLLFLQVADIRVHHLHTHLPVGVLLCDPNGRSREMISLTTIAKLYESAAGVPLIGGCSVRNSSGAVHRRSIMIKSPQYLLNKSFLLFSS
jgi:hypothetical protein